MRLKYNAPVVLSFSITCVFILFITQLFFPRLIVDWFMVHGRNSFDPAAINHLVSILTHTLGHVSWAHLTGNIMLILVIGPLLEENYGTPWLLLMILITAAVTGILNIIFFNSTLLGASGVVFMMILLSSFTNFSKGEIPLTFILVLFLFIGQEILKTLSPESSNISHFAHIIGGFCGSFFGFFRMNRNLQSKKHVSVTQKNSTITQRSGK